MSREIIQLKSTDFANGTQINPLKHFHKQSIILFYADWCGHCHTFMPIYKKLANNIGNSFPVLAIEHKEIEKVKGLNVTGFPTIRFVDNKGAIYSEYSGPRGDKAIMTHICKMMSTKQAWC